MPDTLRRITPSHTLEFVKFQTLYESYYMSEISKLRAERDQLVDKANLINGQYPNNKQMPKAASDDLDGLLNQIEKVDALLDVHLARPNGATDWRDENNSDLKVLRGVADIRSHFGRKAAAGGGMMAGERIQLDDFVRGVANMRTTPAVQAALSVGTDVGGGFLVPATVMAGILEALVPASSLLTAGAGILPLGQGAKSFTTVAIDSIPNSAWRLESGNIAMSDPTFRAVVAAPKSLAFYFKVSRELLADAANISQALTVAITQSFAKELDRAGLLGTGTAPEPRGLANTSGISAVSNGANGAALANYANFFTGINSILSLNAPTPTAAIMSPRSLTKLGGLLDSTGQPLNVPPMLQPVKMIATTAVSNTLTVGTSTDCSQIFLGDFTNLVFAMREQMSIQLLDQTFATTGEIGFMCHCRADVMVTYPAAFALITGVRA